MFPLVCTLFVDFKSLATVPISYTYHQWSFHTVLMAQFKNQEEGYPDLEITVATFLEDQLALVIGWLSSPYYYCYCKF